MHLRIWGVDWQSNVICESFSFILVTPEYGFVCKEVNWCNICLCCLIFINSSILTYYTKQLQSSKTCSLQGFTSKVCEKDKEYQSCFRYYLYKFTLSLEFCTTEVTPDSWSTPKILFCHSLRTRPLGPYFATKRTWIFLSRALYTF